MIWSDIWHKYHEWYFKIVIRNLRKFWNMTRWYFKIVIRNLRKFWNMTSCIYAKYHAQILLLFVYTTTRQRFVIFTCRYFKLSWNTTALSQSNCRNFSCSSIIIFSSWNFTFFWQILFWFWKKKNTFKSFWQLLHTGRTRNSKRAQNIFQMVAGQNIGKNVTNLCFIFYLNFYKEKNLRFTNENFPVYSRMRMFITG